MTAPQLWMVLARCHKALALLVERDIARLGLCVSDFMVLEALLHEGPLTISKIQAKVLLASGSMTAAVDRLESRGLAVRKSTPGDRRSWRIELTPDGRRLIEGAFRDHARHLADAVVVLHEKEKKQVYNGLKKLGLSVASQIGNKV
jgi:MarR family 2-MHQ and catechol resistance regulon transcriptional repressor